MRTKISHSFKKALDLLATKRTQQFLSVGNLYVKLQQQLQKQLDRQLREHQQLHEQLDRLFRMIQVDPNLFTATQSVVKS